MIIGKKRRDPAPPKPATAARAPAKRAPRPKQPEPDWSRDADIRFYIGSTGTGKTHAVREDLARHRGPAWIWDYKREWRELPAAYTARELVRLARSTPRLRFIPSLDDDVLERQFAFFCDAAWRLQHWQPRRELFFLVEEIHAVLPNIVKPPKRWREIVVMGRAYGFVVGATTQSPAFVDKAFTGNATHIRCGTLGEPRHAKVIADRIGVDAGDILNLPRRDAWIFEDGRGVRRYQAPA